MVLKFRNNVQLKFIVTYFVLISGLLVLLNTYPIIVSRDLVFTSKRTSLQNQAAVMSSALAPLEVLSVDGASRVMNLLDIMPLSRVIITDMNGMIIYDASEDEARIGGLADFTEVNRALLGNIVFKSEYTGESFRSRSAAPVINHGEIIGAVYLYEHDEQQAQLISGMQSNLGNVSIAVGTVSLLIIVILTRTLTRRIRELVKAVRIVKDGEYEHRIQIKGKDELTELGEEFNNLTDRLQETEEVRRRFVSDASHELKTPLASIRLLSDSILQSGSMDMDTVLEFVHDIGNEAERLRRTSEKLLSLTKLDHMEQVYRTAVDVKLVVEDTMRLLAPLADNDGVHLEFDLDEDCRIFATEDDVYQIIFNIVENAIKYNLPGGKVHISLFRDGEEVCLEVEDTGIGIPDGDLPHVFSRFYRVDKARSSEVGGSGLGLSIVKDAAEAHGGWVEVSQIEPHGTCLTVFFPAYSEG